MNFVKHMRQPEFLQLEQAASGLRAISLYTKNIHVVDFVNQVFTPRLVINSRGTAVAISSNGMWAAYVQGYVIVVANVTTKEVRRFPVPTMVDRVAISDDGETIATSDAVFDGTVYRIKDTLTEEKLDPLYGRKHLTFLQNELIIGDDSKFGPPGNLVSASSMIIGLFGEFIITEDGNISNGKNTVDLAERIYSASNCGRYLVVRTSTSYYAVLKATMAHQKLTSTDLSQLPVPKSISVGSDFKAYTGEQLSVIEEEAALTISGPSDWMAKFSSLIVNDVEFEIQPVEGSVTLTTDLKKADVKQLYFGRVNAENDSERLMASSGLFESFNTVPAPAKYHYISYHPLMDAPILKTVPESVKSPSAFDWVFENKMMSNFETIQKSIPIPEKYQYISYHPLMDSQVLLFAPAAVKNPTTYDWVFENEMMFKFNTVGRSVSVSTYFEPFVEPISATTTQISAIGTGGSGNQSVGVMSGRFGTPARLDGLYVSAYAYDNVNSGTKDFALYVSTTESISMSSGTTAVALRNLADKYQTIELPGLGITLNMADGDKRATAIGWVIRGLLSSTYSKWRATPSLGNVIKFSA